jgi:hypothetical protein
MYFYGWIFYLLRNKFEHQKLCCRDIGLFYRTLNDNPGHQFITGRMHRPEMGTCNQLFYYLSEVDKITKTNRNEKIVVKLEVKV